MLKPYQKPSRPTGWSAFKPAVILVALLALAAAAPPSLAAEAPAAAEPALKEIQIAAEAFTRGGPVPAWVQQPPAIPPTTRTNPYVMRLWDTQIRAAATPGLYVNRAMQINSASVLARMGQYPIEFAPSYNKLHLHAVKILRGNQVLDQTKTVNVRFLQRELGLENGMYTGTVTASLLISDLRVGDTLQVVYSQEGDNPVFGGVFTDFAGWDDDVPVEQRNVTFSHPTQRRMQWKMMGEWRNTAVNPLITEAGGWRTLRFSDRNMEPLEGEPQIPPSYLPFRYIEFTETGTWNDVARWANGLFPPVAALPDELKTLVAKLRTLPSDDARAMGALQWVQSQIRYFSVSMGESSHRPHPPADVVRQRFGDCKDKAYLLVTLLRELGLDAKPVLLAVERPQLPGKLLPTAHAFDHVIVQLTLGGKRYWLDGTRQGQTGRLDDMGLVLEGAQGLVVAPDTTELTTLSWPNAAALATVDLTEDFTLAGFEADATLASRRTWYGNGAEYGRTYVSQLTPEQLRKFALSYYERRYPGIDLIDAPTLSDDRERNTYTLVSRFKVPKLAAEYSGSWAVKFMPGNLQGTVNVPDNIKRNFPVVAINYPFHAHYKMSITWPESVTVMRDPETRRQRGDFFDLDVSRSFRGNRSLVEVDLVTRKADVAAKDLPQLLDDLKKLDRNIGGTEYVDRTMIKQAPGLLGLGRSTLRDTMRRRLETDLERTGKTIQAGTLSGEDLAEALCTRAELLADLERPAEGLKDAEEAVRIAPSLARAWMCRGTLYADNQQFERSLPDLTKALTLGASDSGVYMRRGLSRYYLGKLAEAAADFGKAAHAGKGESEDPYPMLWQAWTLQRLGQDLPADLRRVAESGAQGSWPRPALAMFAAKLAPEDLIAELNRKTGDERDMNLTEAWFYVGQFHLLQGRTAQARDAFRKARDKGVSMYLEYMAAGWELSRLEGR